MEWFWELREGKSYLSSPDWSATWVPLCPPGLEPPSLPLLLEPEVTETALCEQIIADDPEMEVMGHAVRVADHIRREEILGPYREKKEASIRDWRCFRANVQEWITGPADCDNPKAIDWVRVWRLFDPSTTSFQGIRNRARIWTECETIISNAERTRASGEMAVKHERMQKNMLYPRNRTWEADDLDGCFDRLHLF